MGGGKMDTISRLFSPSPFPFFESQAAATQAYLWRLEPLRAAVQANRVSQVERLREELGTDYSRATAAGQCVLHAIQQGHLFPVSRELLIRLRDDAQSILDSAQEIAELLLRRRFDGPEEINETASRLVCSATTMACLPVELLRRLRQLNRFGWGGSEIESFVTLMRDARSECVRIQTARTEFEWRLNVSPNDLNPLSLVHLRELLSALRQLVSRVRLLADHLSLIAGGDDLPMRVPTAPDTSSQEPHPDSQAAHSDSYYPTWIAKDGTDQADRSTVGS